MRIIYISKSPSFDDVIRNNLKELSENDSVIFFYSYTEAEDFINNKVIRDQATIDLIISENNINSQKAIDFFKKITSNKIRTYSNCDFNFHTIPFVLLADKGENKASFHGQGFFNVLVSLGVDKLNIYVTELVTAVRDWRKQVLDELDNLGIKFNSGKIDYSHYFANDRKRNINTLILSENFKLFPRKLNYDWLNFNDKQIEKAIDLYIKELKRAARLDKKKDEKRFHELFNKYPFFLKRDNYSKHWYEPRLHYKKTNYWEPDYTLQPNFNQRLDLSVLEVKLPTEGFLKKTNFHSKPYSKILDHIFQVNDYKEYLESEGYHKIIKKVFGFIPDTIEYNVLLGRLDEKNKHFDIFNKRMKEMNATYINFITYDELLNYQVKYLDRMKVLHIK